MKERIRAIPQEEIAGFLLKEVISSNGEYYGYRP
jgi:hypothetical protein